MLARLMAMGLTEVQAKEIINHYAAMRDWDGLERYVRLIEIFYDDSYQYPKEGA